MAALPPSISSKSAAKSNQGNGSGGDKDSSSYNRGDTKENGGKKDDKKDEDKSQGSEDNGGDGKDQVVGDVEENGSDDDEYESAQEDPWPEDAWKDISQPIRDVAPTSKEDLEKFEHVLYHGQPFQKASPQALPPDRDEQNEEATEQSSKGPLNNVSSTTWDVRADVRRDLKVSRRVDNRDEYYKLFGDGTRVWRVSGKRFELGEAAWTGGRQGMEEEAFVKSRWNSRTEVSMEDMQKAGWEVEPFNKEGWRLWFWAPDGKDFLATVPTNLLEHIQ